MTIKEWLNLARNKLGAPLSGYSPYTDIDDCNRRIQEVTKILNEVADLTDKQEALSRKLLASCKEAYGHLLTRPARKDEGDLMTNLKQAISEAEAQMGGVK